MRNTTNPYRERYHQIDGWRGYTIPARAVAGVSDTGMYDDSPAPTDKAMAELKRVQREVLRANGIKSRIRSSQSSNVFMVKHWLVVIEHDDFAKAAQLVVNWCDDNNASTHYVHDADLDTCGYKPNAQVDAEIMAAPPPELRP